MGMYMRTFLLIFIVLLLCSCQPQSHDHTLRISATNWLGYTPLFYVKEKGSLDLIDIKLINVVSLSENMYLFKAGNSDAFCGTQYELSILKSQLPNVVPIMLFDRSNGGDMVMSNHSISELQNSTNEIDAYLEMDSINFTVLNDFIYKFNIDEKRVNYIDRDQSAISSLTNNEPNKQILIVTYMPYDSKLKHNGFKEIISTKNGLDLLVIDALFTRTEEFIAHKAQFIALKKLVDEAIASLHSDPKEFYETIKPYFTDLTYEDFVTELHDIEWINKELEDALKLRMQESDFSTKELI